MVIETKRLILRPFLETDAADVYAYLKEPAVNCFASMKLVREKKGVFEGIKEDIEIIGFINCGGCPAKKQSSEQENWLSVGQILLYLQAASRRERQ